MYLEHKQAAHLGSLQEGHTTCPAEETLTHTRTHTHASYIFQMSHIRFVPRLDLDQEVIFHILVLQREKK